MDEIIPCTRRSSSSSAASSNPATTPPPAVEIIFLVTAVTSDGRPLLPLLPPRHGPGAQKQAHPRPEIAVGARAPEVRRSIVTSMLVPCCWYAVGRCNPPPPLEPSGSKRESKPNPNPLDEEPGVLPLQRQWSIVCGTHEGVCCATCSLSPGLVLRARKLASYPARKPNRRLFVEPRA